MASGEWPIVDGGAWGKMKYNLVDPTFDFKFNGHGLVAGEEYTLIYYPDKEGNPWPRTNIRCLASGMAKLVIGNASLIGRLGNKLNARGFNSLLHLR